MKEPYTKIEKAVGTVLILAGITLLATLLVIGRGKNWFQKYVTYYITFDKGYHLKDDAAVRLYNAEIGKINRIDLYQNKVKIELKILDEYKYRIKTDSVASVRNAAFFYGTEYIAIKPGSKGAALIPVGGQIPFEHKPSLEDMLYESGLQDTVEQLLGALVDIKDIVRKLRDPEGLIASSAHRLGNAIADGKSITQELEAGRGSAGQLLASDELVEKIRFEFEKLKSILDHLDDTSSTFPQATHQIVESLDRVKHMLSDALEGISSIKNTLKEVETGGKLMPELTRPERVDIGKIRETLDNANNMIKSLQEKIQTQSETLSNPSRHTDTID